MKLGREHDAGGGVTLTEYHDDDGTLVGYFVKGDAAPQCPSPREGRCGGLCAVRPYDGYSVWQVSGEWPDITLAPSVACQCGGQHAFVVNGQWTGQPPVTPGDTTTTPEGLQVFVDAAGRPTK